MNKNPQELESCLEDKVLSQYNLPQDETTWRSHDDIGPDDIVHYFSRGNQKYALVRNFHPNTTFIHEEKLRPVIVSGGADEWLHIETGDLAGYYSLYEDY